MRPNDREFALKIEDSAGVAETLTASNVVERMRAPDGISVPVEQYDPEEVQGSSSVRPLLPGVRGLEPSVSYVLRAPDSLSIVPACAPFLRSAMMRQAAVTLIGIGAVTGGPFAHGETVTGGTSGATGTVMVETPTGAAGLRLIDVTGTLQNSEVLTGGTSGATATTSDAGAAGGTAFVPNDSDFGAGDDDHHVTCEWRQGGFFWRGRGCLSTMRIEMQVGRPAIVSHAFRGAYAAHGDAALWDVESYAEELLPVPRWLNSQLTFGSYSPELLVGMTFDAGVETELLQDANSSQPDGVRYCGYSKQAQGPSLSLDPKAVLAASHDLYTYLTSGATFSVRFRLGSDLGDGSIWDFFAPEAQIREATPTARNNVMVNTLSLRLCGRRNQEYVWLQR